MPRGLQGATLSYPAPVPSPSYGAPDAPLKPYQKQGMALNVENSLKQRQGVQTNAAFQEWYGKLSDEEKAPFKPQDTVRENSPGVTSTFPGGVGSISVTKADGKTAYQDGDNTEGITKENARQHFLKNIAQPGTPSVVPPPSGPTVLGPPIGGAPDSIEPYRADYQTRQGQVDSAVDARTHPGQYDVPRGTSPDQLPARALTLEQIQHMAVADRIAQQRADAATRLADARAAQLGHKPAAPAKQLNPEEADRIKAQTAKLNAEAQQVGQPKPGAKTPPTQQEKDLERAVQKTFNDRWKEYSTKTVTEMGVTKSVPIPEKERDPAKRPDLGKIREELSPKPAPKLGEITPYPEDVKNAAETQRRNQEAAMISQTHPQDNTPYTHTAVNDKGERVGFNPITKQWEPL